MTITLIYIGKDKFSFISEGVQTFQKRLKHYCKFRIIEVADVKKAGNLTIDALKLKEAEKLIKHCPENSFIILLDEKGKTYSSVSFADFIAKKNLQGVAHLTFIIGGAFGFSNKLYDIANHKISLSSMTFSHQLIRIIFVEQLYRAFTIINNQPYHNK